MEIYRELDQKKESNENLKPSQNINSNPELFSTPTELV